MLNMQCILRHIKLYMHNKLQGQPIIQLNWYVNPTVHDAVRVNYKDS